jgi:hypothetical protein
LGDALDRFGVSAHLNFGFERDFWILGRFATPGEFLATEFFDGEGCLRANYDGFGLWSDF